MFSLDPNRLDPARVRAVHPIPPRILNGALSDLAARIARRICRAVGPDSTTRFVRADVDGRTAVAIHARIDDGQGPVRGLRTVWIEASDRSFAGLHVLGAAGAGPGARGLRIDVLAGARSDTRVAIDLPAAAGGVPRRIVGLTPIVHELVRAGRPVGGATQVPGMSPDGVAVRIPQRAVDLVVDAALRYTDAFIARSRDAGGRGDPAVWPPCAEHRERITRAWRRLEPRVGEVVADALLPHAAALAI